MTTATLFAPSLPSAPGAQRATRAASALLSLMNFYEQDPVVEDSGESETELMVMLSGMVAVDTSLLDGE